MRIDDITPKWLPSFVNYIEDALLLCFKGQYMYWNIQPRRAILLINMDYLGIYRRLEYKTTSEVLIGKWVFSVIQQFYQTVILRVGDSMIRFLLLKKKNPESYGTFILFRKRDQIRDVHIDLQMLRASYTPCVMFVDAGINNSSTCHIY